MTEWKWILNNRCKGQYGPPPLSNHTPQRFFPPHTLPSSDDDTSQSSLVSDTPSLFSISSETPPQDILVPDPPRRPTPSRLNADWQTFYRDALQPTTLDAAPIHATHEPLPPPLRPAPNLPCGDHLHPATSHFRLWSNNLNDLSAHNNFNTLHALLANLTNHNISAFAFQATNLDLTQHDIRSRILSIFKEHYGSAKLVTSTPCIKAPTPWKPGGVLLAIVGPWSHAIVDMSTDDMGRWTTTTLTGRDGSLFTLGSLCNCIKTNIRNAGLSTAFAQQWQLLRLAGVANPSPRQPLDNNVSTTLPKRRPSGSVTRSPYSSLATSMSHSTSTSTPTSWHRPVPASTFTTSWMICMATLLTFLRTPVAAPSWTTPWLLTRYSHTSKQAASTYLTNFITQTIVPPTLISTFQRCLALLYHDRWPRPTLRLHFLRHLIQVRRQSLRPPARK
jgi:hypothetical protein